MGLTLKKEATFSGMGAGDKVVLDLNAAGVYHEIMLDCRKAAAATMSEAEIEADIGTIKVKLNGETIQEFTAAQCFDLWRYYYAQYGAHTVASMIPIHFTRPMFNRMIDRSAMGLGMKGVQTLTVEVDIIGVVTLASITPFTKIEPDDSRGPGRHLRIRSLPDYAAAVGLQQVPKKFLTGNPNVALLAAHFDTGAGAATVTNFTLKGSAGQGVDVDIFPEITPPLNELLIHDAGRTPQTNWNHIDLCLENDPVGPLNMGRLTGLRLDIVWVTAAPLAWQLLLEEIHGLQGPLV